MANKYFYYVLIACEEGQGKFVTKVDNSTKYAYWNTNEKPMEFSKQYAEDLAYCLCLNFNPAFVLRSDFKIEQHYFYKNPDLERERLKTLLYNALVWIEKENSNYFVSSVGDEYEWFEKALGITEKEMKDIGIDWLSKGAEEDDE